MVLTMKRRPRATPTAIPIVLFELRVEVEVDCDDVEFVVELLSAGIATMVESRLSGKMHCETEKLLRS